MCFSCIRHCRYSVLDHMDETLETKMHRHPSLLLIQPSDHQKTPPPPAAAGAVAGAADGGGIGVPGDGDVDVAESSVESGDGSEAKELVLCCLRFLAMLMRNCVNKHVFSSSEVRLLCVCPCVLHVHVVPRCVFLF